MSPLFFHDYVPAIVAEIEWHRAGPGIRVPLFRCHAVDADGKVMIGANSWDSADHARHRLLGFVGRELIERAAHPVQLGTEPLT